MDVSNAIVAKSDQLNAIDLVGGDVTVTIVEVKPGPADQPVHIVTDVFGPGRPWKPSKTALRDIVQPWGTDSTAWIGRRLTLWNDPEVLWAGQKVGGVRIRAMSNIPEAFQATHIITRGKSKKVMIQPLADAPVIDLTPHLSAIQSAETMDDLAGVWQGIVAAGLGGHPELVAAKNQRKGEVQ